MRSPYDASDRLMGWLFLTMAGFMMTAVICGAVYIAYQAVGVFGFTVVGIPIAAAWFIWRDH